jgi:hypothetical protein
MTPNHIKTLYALNIVSLCAVFGLFFLYVRAPQQSLGIDQFGATSKMQPVRDVFVGNNADTPAARIQGPILQVIGSVLTVKDRATEQTYAVSINAGTKIERVGPQKNSAEYQKEMDAYYAQIKLLMQDPVKNKVELSSLVIPTPIQLTSDTPASLALGDVVEVIAASPITGESFTAVKIVIYPQATKY